jgi:hypothetical protein
MSLFIVIAGHSPCNPWMIFMDYRYLLAAKPAMTMLSNNIGDKATFHFLDFILEE